MNLPVDSPVELSIDRKIRKVLTKLMEPSNELINNANFNLLLRYLSTYNGNEESKHFILDWLIKIVTKWKKAKQTPNPYVLILATNLLRNFIGIDNIFVKLNNENVFEYLVEISINAMRDPTQQPNIEIAFVKLLLTFMNHKTGLQWIIATKNWATILKMTVNHHNDHVSKESRKFISEFLIKITPIDKVLVQHIMHSIFSPLAEALRSVASKDISTNEDTLYESLSPTLDLITEVLLRSLEKQVTSNEKEQIFEIAEVYGLEKLVLKMISSINDEKFLHDLYRIAALFGFFEMHLKSTYKTLFEDERFCTQKICNIIFGAVSKGKVLSILEFTCTILNYWQIMKKSLSTGLYLNPVEYTIEDQLMTLQLLPTCHIAIKIAETPNESNNFGQQFEQKFVDRIGPKTTRVCYKWLPHLKQNCSLEYGIIALKYFLSSRRYYERDTAMFALKVFTNNLAETINLLDSRPDLMNFFSTQPEFLAHLLESIAVIIEEYSVTCKDAKETLFILHALYDFLTKFTWPARIVVEALSLANKSIAHYMSPQMVFLMDNSDDCIVVPFLSMVHLKLYDEDWEVRVSAIEFITTVASTLNTKFPSSRIPLVENDFPCTILIMASKDKSSFVNAAALKCLQEMIQITEFWNIFLSNGNILVKCLSFLNAEADVIIRKEAASLIDSIYRHQDIPEDDLIRFYDKMSDAVISDLHGEVRVRALHFWRSVIDDHLAQQGMVDGVFPTCIFSKEHRKIVNLSEQKIKEGLIKILHQLSLIGCLTTLCIALQDQRDLEVSRNAADIISEFVSLLKKYRITSLEVASFTKFCGSKTPFDEPQCTFDCLVLKRIKEEIVLPPHEFVNFVYSHLDLMKERVKDDEKLNDFNSLLDDILECDQMM